MKNSGVYILCINLEKEKRIKIGSLGKFNFEKGMYFYVGRGKRNIQKRIKRHLRKKKKMRWHIDYFLKYGKIEFIILIDTEPEKECEIAKTLSKRFLPILKFGCSDCKCKSHLFLFKRREK